MLKLYQIKKSYKQKKINMMISFKKKHTKNLSHILNLNENSILTMFQNKKG